MQSFDENFLASSYRNVWLRNKETQQSLQFIVNIVMQGGCVDDVISLKQHVSVTLQ